PGRPFEAICGPLSGSIASGVAKCERPTGLEGATIRGWVESAHGTGQGLTTTQICVVWIRQRNFAWSDNADLRGQDGVLDAGHEVPEGTSGDPAGFSVLLGGLRPQH